MSVSPLISLPSPDVPHPRRLVCGPCTQLLGVEHRPRCQIKPAYALLLASGAIIIENPVILCATCLGRGVETQL